MKMMPGALSIGLLAPAWPCGRGTIPLGGGWGGGLLTRRHGTIYPSIYAHHDEVALLSIIEILHDHSCIYVLYYQNSYAFGI